MTGVQTCALPICFPVTIAGTVRFRDGDVFTGLGDSTVTPMLEYRAGIDIDPTKDPSDSCWQIREMVITDTYTECTVGSTYFSIFDIYRTALKRYDGCPAPTETKDIETNLCIVSTHD